MPKVVNINQAFTRFKLEYNQCFIDEINKIEPDTIHMLYEKDGELFYAHSDVSIIEQLGALQYLSQCAFFDYIDDDSEE